MSNTKATSIKVNISGREYPLNVTPETEASMKEAVALVNENIKSYSAAYAIKDPRDLLAMCALQLAFQYIESDNEKKPYDEKKVEMKLKAIEAALQIAG
ncbi:MAG TPA: cell division protein ZapA [Bacteroidia bacterium]|jgi:cell division protein ZapA (FtsZ GTPase activity inhibitor)|nr:cell division protein ZapA [Bacteroidia bacterium]